MSNNLNGLLARVARADAGLAEELRLQIDGLSKRREFGLNFERHTPEKVPLIGLPITVGDKVTFIPPRGEAGVESDDTWIVEKITGTGKQRLASLRHGERTHEKTTRPVADLVYTADFRDPIYPGLVSTGKVERGGDKPFHAVITSENYHALEAMLFSCQGKVDAIYIDPPYNTGAKDWKYNNNYVDGEDDYRHSKWLSFMERRLKMAKKLLNPDNSVLIVTIDEKEYLRLGMLLEQSFPAARIQMVSVFINPASVARDGYFGRSDEYIYFVMLGSAGAKPVALGADWVTSKGRTHRGEIRWDLLRKSGSSPTREGHPETFYPFFVTNDGKRFHSVGEPIGIGASRHDTVPPAGTFAVWPIRRDGTEGRWRLKPATVRTVLSDGCLRLGDAKGESTPIYYLAAGERGKIRHGIYSVVGRREDGSVVTDALEASERRLVPGTQWRIGGHDATQYGTRLLLNLLPDRKFPFPKSLYAVEDTLRFFVADNPSALVVDFFGGSGTTAHAVMRLNRQDGGRRRAIIVTNNEVSADEQRALREKALRPGDAAWEAFGICDYITKPRIEAAITGETPQGDPVKGDYKFTDEFPMADGFDESVEFFTLTYENPTLVSLDLAFERIAPLLWMRSGAEGRRIDHHNGTFEVADTYGVLFNVDASSGFLKAIERGSRIRDAYIVTDDEKQFQMIAASLPGHVEKVRLYESYLRTFEINTGKE